MRSRGTVLILVTESGNGLVAGVHTRGVMMLFATQCVRERLG